MNELLLPLIILHLSCMPLHSLLHNVFKGLNINLSLDLLHIDMSL
jgi:hypothetical protein